MCGKKKTWDRPKAASTSCERAFSMEIFQFRKKKSGSRYGYGAPLGHNHFAHFSRERHIFKTSLEISFDSCVWNSCTTCIFGVTPSCCRLLGIHLMGLEDIIFSSSFNPISVVLSFSTTIPSPPPFPFYLSPRSVGFPLLLEQGKNQKKTRFPPLPIVHGVMD